MKKKFGEINFAGIQELTPQFAYLSVTVHA
jgi:hypothetical protein